MRVRRPPVLRTSGAFAQHGADPENLMRVTALAASLDAVPGAAGAIPSIPVVDDERPLREVLVRVLRRRGFEALEAPGAETACRCSAPPRARSAW